MRRICSRNSTSFVTQFHALAVILFAHRILFSFFNAPELPIQLLGGWGQLGFSAQRGFAGFIHQIDRLSGKKAVPLIL